MFSREEQYELKIKSTTDVNMSNWQITNLLDTMTMVNNKFDVLANIINLLNTGVEKKNVFVTDKSFLISTNYKTYFNKGDTFNDDDIVKMSYIGKIIPMNENSDLTNINCLFSYYKKLNSLLNKQFRCRLKGIYLTESYKVLFKEGIKVSYHILTEGAKKQIVDAYERFITPNYGKRDKLIQEIEQCEAKYLRKYIDENKKISINCESRFEYCFNRNERPIVGIYNQEEHSIRIINSDQMYKNGEEAVNPIRLKNVSKNSPVLIALGVTGIMLGFLGYLVYRDHKVSNNIVEDNMFDFPRDNNTAINNILGSQGRSVVEIETFRQVDSQIKTLAEQNLRRLEIITNHRVVSLELNKEE